MEPKGHLARWVMHLQEYEFDVVHRAGSENGNANGLSRPTPLYRGTPRVADTSVFSTTCATTINPSCNLQAAQREDPRLKVVIDLKSSGMPKPSFLSGFMIPFSRHFGITGILRIFFTRILIRYPFIFGSVRFSGHS